jgi:putative transferase (TIGR04331 family)
LNPVFVAPDSVKKLELFQLSNDVYEHLLPELSRFLNAFHKTNKPTRYWEIITGVWLRMFVDAVVSRVHIAQSTESYDSYFTMLASDSDDSVNFLATKDLSTFQSALKSSDWNSRIYSDVFMHLKGLSKEKELAPAVDNQYEKQESKRLGRSYVSSTYLPRQMELFLALTLGTFPHRIQRTTALDQPVNAAVRTFRLQHSKNPAVVELIVADLILKYLPKSYLEEFLSLKQTALSHFPKRIPHSVFTANRHLYDDGFNIWAAEKMMAGSKIVLAQHGGHFGTSRFPSFAERHEISVADRYFTWGWMSNAKCFPLFVITKAGAAPRKKANGSILLVVTDHVWTHPRSFFLDIQEAGNYLPFMSDIVKGLTSETQQNTVLRIHHGHAETGSPQDMWWTSQVPQIRQDDGTISFSSLLSDAKLVLTSHNGTTFPETISSGVPTVIAWDSSFVQIRPDAEPVFQLMERAGMFHSTPESAAAFINRIWDDVDGWWNSPQVIDARSQFCNQYARTVPHPVRFLAKALKF